MGITNKSGGSATGVSTLTGSGGGGGDGASCTSGAFVYSMAKTSLGEACLVKIKNLGNSYHSILWSELIYSEE
jgi:hypothetical protein